MNRNEPRRDPHEEATSPELALVDPALRERAGALPPAAEPTRERAVAPELSRSRPFADPDALEAVRRLNELAELEPAGPPARSARLLSLSFAALAWLVVVLMVVDLQPWRV